MLKKFFLFLFLFSLFLPLLKIEAQSAKAGFVSSSIWFSNDSLIEGDKTKIYAMVFNPDNRELSGTVVFFDKNTFLGKKDFKAPAKRAVDVFIDWTVTAGDHNIFGKIENAKFLLSSGQYEEIYLPEDETERTSVSISKKINNKEENSTETASTDNTGTINSFSKIDDLIKEKTPGFISKPINLVIQKSEIVRENIAQESDKAKTEAQQELKKIEPKPTVVQKPLEYLKLFFWQLVYFVSSQKIIFYILIAFLILMIFRFVWNKIL